MIRPYVLGSDDLPPATSTVYLGVHVAGVEVGNLVNTIREENPITNPIVHSSFFMLVLEHLGIISYCGVFWLIHTT